MAIIVPATAIVPKDSALDANNRRYVFRAVIAISTRSLIESRDADYRVVVDYVTATRGEWAASRLLSITSMGDAMIDSCRQ